MGLPEVADFARKFAVMVRVQGPDPKGLKMRNHAFHHYNSGKTTLSASGILFPGSGSSVATDIMKSSGTSMVLTVASVIEPFISQESREKSTSKEKPCLVPGVQIDVLVENKSRVEGSMEALTWLSAELLMMVDIPQSSAAVESLVEASYGSVENNWEVGWSLASHNRGPNHIMNSSCAQVEQASSQNKWPMLGPESQNTNRIGQSASRIALLAINSEHLLKITSKSSVDCLKLKTFVPKHGDVLLAMGSPFGILSPLHFFNNISVGSIANSYPPNSLTSSLLMADIRCLPGMEGSPVFNDHAQFIGLLTRPLRQKVSGTEIPLVIPWDAIASVCGDLLQEEPLIAQEGIDFNNRNLKTVGNVLPEICSNDSNILPKTNPGARLPSPVEKAMSSICLITTEDGSWASGVLLNKQGLVLTNAHLLEPWRFGKTDLNVGRNETKLESAVIARNELVHKEADTYNGERLMQNLPTTNKITADVSSNHEHALSRLSSAKQSHRKIRVRLDCLDPWVWIDATIVYISRGPLDIALLQLETVPDHLSPIIMDVDCPTPGSKAYVIGHGLFGPRCDLLPSACLGVIAKVIKANKSPHVTTNRSSFHEQFPAMLETTAAVHPGSSGGSVVNSVGHMIGLVTSNAKHGGGTVIPHLNFSIPSAALEPILIFSKDMRDSSILEELNKPNEQLSSVWALVPPLYPKSEPLLPEVPQFQEDKRKEIKGSRFGKFIAERNELLKKTTRHGTPRSFTDELIQSKL